MGLSLAPLALGARLPRNPVGWLFLAIGLVWALYLPANLFVADAHEAFRPAPTLIVVVAWLVSSFSTPVLLGLLALAGLLFPDGRLPSRRWRPVVWLTAIAALTFGLSVGLDPSGLDAYPSLPNPFAAPPTLEPIFPLSRAARLAILLPLVAVSVSLALRYRVGDLVVRAQLRWIVFAATLQGLVVIPLIVGTFVVGVSETVGQLFAALQIVGVTVPLAAAFAITRYHLFGIDVLIGRTLVYVPLMGALGGLYALAVALFQRVFAALTGGSSDVPLLIALFLTAAAFTPLRKAFEAAVDRWARRSSPPPGSARPAEVEAGPGAGAGVGSGAGAGAGAGSEAGAEVDEPELRRVAAALISLRRLEARMTGAPRAGDGSTEAAWALEHSLSVDAAGLVSCPRGQRVPFAACLGCSHLQGISISPPQVRCLLRDLP